MFPTIQSTTMIIPIHSTTSEESTEQDRPYLFSNTTLPPYSNTTDSNTTLLPPAYDSIKSFSIIAPSIMYYRYSIISTLTTLLTSLIYLIFLYFNDSSSSSSSSSSSTTTKTLKIKIFLTLLSSILLFSNGIGLWSGGSLLLDLNPKFKILNQKRWEIKFGVFVSAISMWIMLWIAFRQSEMLIRVYSFLVLSSVQAIIFEHLSHTATVTDLERRLKLSENRLRALI